MGPDEPTLQWDANGRMFEDSGLTVPTRYRLVELGDEHDDPYALRDIVLGTVEPDDDDD